MSRQKLGFTLAEVLITLGIIGIIAAMTMPALMQNYARLVVETRLKKFYSSLNQALIRAEADYGDKKLWYSDSSGAIFDKDGKPIPGSSEEEKWIRKYLLPYLNSAKIETVTDGGDKTKGAFIVILPDGSAFMPRAHTTRDWIFYTNWKKCISVYGYGVNESSGGSGEGVCKFMFGYVPSATLINAAGGTEKYWKYHINKGFEPWKHAWNGNLTDLENACIKKTKIYLYDGSLYCAAFIQLNGWHIPKNYPYRLIY